MLMTSSFSISSSALSITMPRREYSRMDLTSRRLALVRFKRGPSRRKAMVLRLSGFTTRLATKPTGVPDWTLMTGVPMSFEQVVNISLL